jgi:hypothetical protein
MKRYATSDPSRPLHPDAVDVREAVVRRGYTIEEFLGWPLAGYDDCGDECRFLPERKEKENE